MMRPLEVRVLDGGVSRLVVVLSGTLEAGRQRSGEPEPYAVLPEADGGPQRLILARQNEDNVARRHVLLEPLPDGAVRVTNGSKIPLVLDGSAVSIIAPGDVADLTPPFSVLLPPRAIAVVVGGSVDEHGIQGLHEKTIQPGILPGLSSQLQTLPSFGPAQLEDLARWLQLTVGVLQSTVGSTNFLDRAAEALVAIVGLDSGRVLLLDGEQWTVAAAHGDTRGDTDRWQPSRHVMDRLQNEKRTFRQHHQAGPAPGDSPSLKRLHGVVAAPLLDCNGQVVGALYGERTQARPPAQGSGPLEAALVEVLAGAVSTGLARQEQERAAAQQQVRFEQFFGAHLARELREHPDLLQGRQAEVTLLFCDVRGFSRASEKLGPARTVEWMSDVLSALSECVLAQEGVLVDYVGDELFAMWGAPREQSDQAERAVRAALAMRTALEELNRRWQEVLGGPMDVGVGINTGPAQVGNTGSRFKFKYGALGSSVNVASRAQGLTKYIKCPLLVTAATRRRLGDNFVARRVCRVRLMNIEEAVDLYEVDTVSSGRGAFFRASEAALDALEAGDFAGAARLAGEPLATDHRRDGPLLLVLSRAATHLMADGDDFDPVWEPPGK
jgi:adenylate cyclase